LIGANMRSKIAAEFPEQMVLLLPGLLLAGGVAVVSRALAATTPLPPVLFALVVGMALSSNAARDGFCRGVAFSGREILRIGVALLGVQITFGDFVELGVPTVAITLSGLIATLLLGTGIARLCGVSPGGAMVSAGSVAICGASAALAIAAALPKESVRDEDVARTVAGITIVGTIMMLLLPSLGLWLELSEDELGILVGGAIHEVAQAVAAGFAVSDHVGKVSTIVKLLRVACLGLVVLAIAMASRKSGRQAGIAPPVFPGFLIAFSIFAAANSVGIIPAPLAAFATEASRWCLLMAIAALGMRTSIGTLLASGAGPLFAIAANSVFLMAIVLAGILAVRF
jgi:uncharacterized integral membrane protein (TIGR00698 family)